MKKIILILISLCSTASLYAANDGDDVQPASNASASQTIQLVLTDQIEIGFVNTGSSVDIPFSTVGEFADGVESGDQQIRVRSNRKFEVKMQANADYFSYSGSSAATPSMKVKDVLSLMVSANGTGGQVNNGFTQYQNINGITNSQILNGCNNGSDQTFSVRYRANPGFQYPAGNYTISMVYTATQS